MPDSSHLSSRKSDHIKINLDRDVRSSIATGLEEYHLIPQALPEIDLDEVDCSLNLLGKCMNSPVLISSMTGGLKEAEKINHNLAEAAQHCRVALGIGSQRAGIEQPELFASFQVRDAAPDILLFGNLGAVQLNYGYTVDECRKAVDMIKADALFLHLNALQEAVQP
ncbi:MAG: type 2 isopentenyl-diphosphate Delta-isomerase, partial [Leptolinea sp.]|nr:type 2 isopentenyl-diphosphate Delta-isomerase [Leptolinea sp.]